MLPDLKLHIGYGLYVCRCKGEVSLQTDGGQKTILKDLPQHLQHWMMSQVKYADKYGYGQGR